MRGTRNSIGQGDARRHGIRDTSHGTSGRPWSMGHKAWGMGQGTRDDMRHGAWGMGQVKTSCY
jgi:hypothetical protein